MLEFKLVRGTGRLLLTFLTWLSFSAGCRSRADAPSALGFQLIMPQPPAAALALPLLLLLLLLVVRTPPPTGARPSPGPDVV